jgi:transcription elongation factor GreA
MNEAELIVDSGTGVFLTPEGYEQLKKELEHLTIVKRPEIAERIRDSQQHGEFSEDNSELDEVKFEQAIVENRIGELRAIFGNASVLDMDKISTERAGVGTVVKVNDLDWDDEFDVRLVFSIEADPNKDFVSIDSPLGTALIGHKAGEEVRFEAPDGMKRVKILALSK